MIWYLAKFELRQGITSSRMIVLGTMFTLFIVGMGGVLGHYQNVDPESVFFVQNSTQALTQFSFFVFFIVSLAAIGVSVDSFHKERQTRKIGYGCLSSEPII